MKKTILFGVALAAVFAGEVAADEYYRGYTRRDGTYVQPHWQSSPNRSYNDNWSVSPNVNPYTGSRGTRQPTFNDRPPRSNSLGGGSIYNPYGSSRGRRY